ncbi:MAG: hypothetical protein H6745_04165 [Deltaproteobacteria bacterium]|nr:hypothetical protein [Deltaproteobacteria bacterium]
MRPATNRGLALATLLAALAVAGCGDSAGDAPADATTSADTATTAATDTTTPTDTAGACPAGKLGCACAEDDAAPCDRGQCVAGVCALCTRGEDGCLCRADGSCQGALLCQAGVCEVCPPGDLGCACDDQGGCAEGGRCQDGACAAVDCAPGTAECPCRRTTSPACDAPLACLGDGTCHACEADRAGCACASDDTCAAGLLCDGASCRAPRSCAVLVAEGFCGAHEICTEGGGVDAQCQPGECEAGYVFYGGRCVEGAPNCRSDAPGSLLDVCTSLLRQCEEGDATASCGACIDDAREVGGECVGRLSCGAGSCLNSEYCDATGVTPTCRPLPCPEGSAMEGDGVCRSCGFTCSGTGLTGRVWPFRTNTSTCVCETVHGYFMPPGGDTRPEICDIDGDGWVREEVRDPALTSDPALTANARCDLVEVTSVVLRDELGVDKRVVSCEEGLLLEPDPTQCFDKVPMPLVESLRNDTPGPLVATTTPPYGGRRLRAEEVNGLTKACVSSLADYDDDGVEDFLEVQTPPERLGDDARERLHSFAYFMETHRAYIERDDAGTPSLVIEERYRCDPNDFPLRYDPSVVPSPEPDDAYAPGDPDTYWRSCTRGADPAYDPGADPPVPGFDFAQWSCPDGGAGCDSIAPGPPSGAQDLRLPIPFGSDFPRDATLCELGSRFPADGVWRGMGHESQFKCVGVGDGPGRRPLTEFGPLGSLVMNLCEATTCSPADPTCADSRPVVPGATSMDPILSCRATSDVDGSDVGFAAVKYKPYGVGYGGDYAGGCVSEDTEYHDTLCPDPVFTVDPDDDAFGANTCHVAPCPFGKADCDGDPLNGCELDATTNQDCGGCGVACAPAFGTGDCSTGRCRVTSCVTGRQDCDDDGNNGCETSTRTLTDCGDCGIPCSVDGGTATCASGVCQVDDCADGLADCSAAAGCETPITTNQNCGGCGILCNPAHASAASCATGECEVTGCQAGWGDCDDNAGNGCESSLTSASHCGSCGNACNLAHASSKCAGTACLVDQCASGWGNCDNVQENGCERQLNSTQYCGSCTNACNLAHASPTCSNGSCRISSCSTGYDNCNGNDGDGCEAVLDNNPSCGSALDLGSFNSDSTCGFSCLVNTGYVIDASPTGRGEAWFKVKAVDNIGICSGVLHHRLKLSVPSGVDYDLYVYPSCASSTPLAKGTSSAGVDETVIVSKDDDSLDDGSFNYWINVKYFGGHSCTDWALTVEGTRCGE